MRATNATLANPMPCRTAERPFDPGWTLAQIDDAEVAIGLRSEHSQAVRAMRASLVANLIRVLAEQCEPPPALYYSRDRSYYAGRAVRRYAPHEFTLSAVCTAIDALVEAGLVEHVKADPGPGVKQRSRIFLTDRLREQAPIHGAVLAVRRTIPEPIVLKNDEKVRVDYRETPRVRGMRAEVMEQNRFIATAAIQLDHLGFRPAPFGFIQVGDRCLCTAATGSYRVFNGDWNHGGRYFGSWWQAVPSGLRAHLTIDGHATVELDYPTCHPRLLCAGAGIDLPFSDPGFDFYRVPGLERAEAKLAVNVLLNAASPRSAALALAGEFRIAGAREADEKARRAIDAIVRHRPELASLWASGIGLRLQNIDAAIATDVHAAMRARGVVCLSVHDSFIVQQRYREALAQAMDDAFSARCRTLQSARIF